MCNSIDDHHMFLASIEHMLDTERTHRWPPDIIMKNTEMRMCGQGGGKTMVGVPDEKDFGGGDVLRWDGIAVFPNASKLAKLVSELPWGAAAVHKETWTRDECGT